MQNKFTTLVAHLAFMAILWVLVVAGGSSILGAMPLETGADAWRVSIGLLLLTLALALANPYLPRSFLTTTTRNKT